MPTFYEFFAGGGMARAGLGRKWRCLFANDFDLKKAAAYAANWGVENLHIGDVRNLSVAALPVRADLAWASFPCQDLSLAGNGAGLNGHRSGAFWPFWDLMRQLAKEGRAPRIVSLENVCGALTSHGGKDFATIAAALAESGYRFGAVIIDAMDFLPQSRPRLFIIGVAADNVIPIDIIGSGPALPWHTSSLVNGFGGLSANVKEQWIWWRLPQPPNRRQNFSDIIEDEPEGVKWHAEKETNRLLTMMSAVNIAKVNAAKLTGRRVVGAVYKRTRVDKSGVKAQRAEVRFDDVAGCLRTPVGGSSRQSILVIEGSQIRSRLLSPREAARLMGLPDDYVLPANYNEAYHLAGDGVAVPIVRYLARTILEPMIAATDSMSMEAA